MYTQETNLNAFGMTTKEVMVYEQIKKDILNNEFEPGTVLVERKLTEKYKVSRSPVRYALRQLVRDGLYQESRGKGLLFRYTHWRIFWRCMIFWRYFRFMPCRFP